MSQLSQTGWAFVNPLSGAWACWTRRCPPGVGSDFVGIDISKNPLSVAIAPGDQTFTYTNSELLACFITPKLLRNFTRGAGIAAKTDRLDAQVLALYAHRMRSQPRALPAVKEISQQRWGKMPISSFIRG